MTEQNKTHAVMSQRHEDQDSLDYFPTPPWATRALFEHILKPNFIYPQQETYRKDKTNSVTDKFLIPDLILNQCG